MTTNKPPQLCEILVSYTRVTEICIQARRNNNRLRKLPIDRQFLQRITAACLADIATPSKSLLARMIHHPGNRR